MKSKPIDIVSVGELLIDMISIDFADKMDEVETFKRIVGGSPANLAMNMRRLGNNVRLASTVGDDDMGNFLMNYVKKLDLDTSLMRQTNLPTTMILVSRSKNVSNFEAYRSADTEIWESQLPDDVLSQTAIFHTTCFAMSKQPAQSNILMGAKRAVELGCQLSIDANYAVKIWENRAEAQRIVAEYSSHGAYVKISEVDWARLYDSELTDPIAAAAHFLNLGAKNVCVTLGGDGCYVADTEGGHFLEARKVDVKDTTGAGDAFWSGFLTARLDGHSILDAAKAARSMAELKLGHFGPLPLNVSKSIIYKDIIM